MWPGPDPGGGCGGSNPPFCSNFLIKYLKIIFFDCFSKELVLFFLFDKILLAEACSIIMKSPDVTLQLLLYNYIIGHASI